MLLNKGPIPQSMGLQSPNVQQYAQPMKNFMTHPSTLAKGLRRLGLPLSLLLQTNNAHAAEMPDFFEQLQRQQQI